MINAVASLLSSINPCEQIIDMCSIMSNNNTSRTLFEHLPVEILHQIFAMLSLREIVRAFSNLNLYITSIIQSMRGLSHTVTCGDIKMICLLRLFPTQISRLVISYTKSLDFTSLFHLRSLTLRYGTPAQFDSIRPNHFPLLEILRIYEMFDTSNDENRQASNDLFQVILSNGFPRLRICIAARMQYVKPNETWTGSLALRTLQLDTNIGDAQFLFDCPNLRRFTSLQILRITSPQIRQYVMYRRMLLESQKLERLQFEGKFILDADSTRYFYSNGLLPDFGGIPLRQWTEESREILQGRILPTSEPYCHASFLIEIHIPSEYPFKPPVATFLDRIHHINISQSGKHCCNWEMISAEWRPTFTIADLVLKVIHVIDNPDLSCHTDAERLKEYRTNASRFYKKALDMTLAYGRSRR